MEISPVPSLRWEYLVRVMRSAIHRLVTDMYYDFRTDDPRTYIRRRTSRPYPDVINSLLAAGYGMLFGNACVSAIGAGLDPDTGFLHKGSGGLIYDLIEPFKRQIDRPSLILSDWESEVRLRG